jgi:hypothetical protein
MCVVSFYVCRTFYTLCNPIIFLFFIFLYSIGKLAWKMFRKVRRNDSNVQCSCFHKQIPTFHVLNRVWKFATLLLFVNLVLYFGDILFVVRNGYFGLTGNLLGVMQEMSLVYSYPQIYYQWQYGRYSEFFATFGVRNRLYFCYFFFRFQWDNLYLCHQKLKIRFRFIQIFQHIT